MSGVIIEYEIVKWGKYNPRSKAQKISWYRQDVGIFEHPEFEHLTKGQMLLYFYLMSKAAKGLGRGRVTLASTRKTTALTSHKIAQTCAYFESIGFIRIISETRTNSRATEQNITEQNITLTSEVTHTPLAQAPKPPPTERQIERLAVQGATEVVAMIHTCGQNEVAAKEKLDPLIWQILTKRFPKNTWANFCAAYRQAIKRERESYFLYELRKHFEAFMPTMQKHLESSA